MDRFRAVLFDLDGTLLDSLQDIANAANAALGQLAFPQHPAEDYKYMVGEGTTVLARRALPADRRDFELVTRCTELIVAEYREHWAENTRPYAGIPELLDALKRHDLALAVLSNKNDEFTQAMVRQLLPHWSFREILGVREGMAKKPDPGGALWIARTLGLAPEHFLYLGDTGIDMQTAKAAGMYGVGVLWGFRMRAELEENGARLVIQHPSELLSLLE